MCRLNLYFIRQKELQACGYLWTKVNISLKIFSTGKGGNKIDLVKELFNMDYSKAVFKIGQDYNKFISDKGVYTQSTLKPEDKV